MVIRVDKEYMKRGWAKELNSLIWEVSEIEERMEDEFMFNRVTVINTDSGNKKVFKFIGADKDGSGEDTYGWNYVADDGMKLLLIND